MSNCPKCCLPIFTGVGGYAGPQCMCLIAQPAQVQSFNTGVLDIVPKFIAFHGAGNKELGRFDFSGDKLAFTGDVEESAKVFLEYLLQQFNGRIEQITKVPEGWKLVPIKPTAAMVFNVKNDHISIFNLYSAMIDAAPEYKP